jgi:hypothetical protein
MTMVHRKGSYREADVSFGLFEVLCKSGYRTLSTNIPEFAKINEMPIPLDIRRIAEGDGIEAAFVKTNQAKYPESTNLFSASPELTKKTEFFST